MAGRMRVLLSPSSFYDAAEAETRMELILVILLRGILCARVAAIPMSSRHPPAAPVQAP